MSNVSTRILDYVDFLRLDASSRVRNQNKEKLEQFFSSAPLASLMASMLNYDKEQIKILDPGAGVGSLFAACIDEILRRDFKPKEISVTAYEIDDSLYEYIKNVFEICGNACKEKGIKFSAELIEKDFIIDSTERLGGLFSSTPSYFNCIIMNPPYGKINVDSKIHRILENSGMDNTNFYSAFVSIAEHLLEKNGELVSITPRSFCNGLYFKPFRIQFLQKMNIIRIHMFNSRHISFRDDKVLQENIIMYATKDRNNLSKSIIISSSDGPEDDLISIQEVDKNKVISPNDPEMFIRIVPDQIEGKIAKNMESLKHTLTDLGLQVSTGKVVDFRALEHIAYKSSANTVPLIHPFNLQNGYVVWPSDQKKPGNIKVVAETKSLLVSKGNYVLTKRFSTKEEPKRVVAAVYDSNKINAPHIAFENRINYYHSNGRGIDIYLANGLSIFLNSTFLDSYFRQFSGHTQVNATDLRNIKYPSLEQLKVLGRHISGNYPNQQEIDEMVSNEIFNMSKAQSGIVQAVAKKKVEAISILKLLDMPKEQQGERSALTLLALLDLKPEDDWSKAKNPMMGIRPMMDFMFEHYGKKYAENTREAVRRQTIHQFLDAGFIIQNPDDCKRPINSQKNVYQIENSVLDLFRSFGTPEFDNNLESFKTKFKTLREKYQLDIQRERISVRINGTHLCLSPGGQNVLVKEIVEHFKPKFSPNGEIIYIGDTDKKYTLFKKEIFNKLGLNIDPHDKMPDVIIYDDERNWLLLIEAVTSHGPVDSKRKGQLERIFGNSDAGIVYVTAFRDRRSMIKYLPKISWETEVWIADAPDHMIHFNGERFLGPYDESKK